MAPRCWTTSTNISAPLALDAYASTSSSVTFAALGVGHRVFVMTLMHRLGFEEDLDMVPASNEEPILTLPSMCPRLQAEFFLHMPRLGRVPKAAGKPAAMSRRIAALKATVNSTGNFDGRRRFESQRKRCRSSVSFRSSRLALLGVSDDGPLARPYGRRVLRFGLLRRAATSHRTRAALPGLLGWCSCGDAVLTCVFR